VNAGTRPGVTSEEPAEIKRLKQEDAKLRRALMTGLIRVLRPAGPGYRRGPAQLRLSRYPPPRPAGCPGKALRARRSRAVLTFFAQDHATADMVYANADIAMVRHAGTAPGHATNIPFCAAPEPVRPHRVAAHSGGFACGSAATPDHAAWSGHQALIRLAHDFRQCRRHQHAAAPERSA